MIQKPKSSIFNSQFKKEDTFWLTLIGNPLAFALESRIFHSISIGLILVSILYAPYNLYAGLYISSLSAFVFALFFAHQYCNSRFNGKKHSNILFGVFGIVIFGVNFFANAGINGSTDLIWPAYLLVLLAITPYSQHLTWLLVYVICFLVLHSIAHVYPDLVKHPFTAGKGQFIDRITAFPLPVLVIYIIIRFMRRSHDNERKTAEEKTIAVEESKAQILIQKEQLEQSNIEKNKLMSIISHDLRTPLFNIQNYLELLNTNEVDSTDRPILEKALLQTTNNTVKMLSNLLHWSRSQMEGIHVQLAEANLLTILSGTLEMEKINALKKEIILSYIIPENLLVIADIDMLQLVIRNLINNAVKFTPSGGSIEIDAQIVLNQCKITVSDNGSGMTADQQKKVFSMQAEPSYGTANEKGVGLGLVLCKEFIERQGGNIDFESKSGLGSSFYIFIPLVQKETI
jgi:two-component system sensor histidine kinase/response regulator